MLSVNLLVVGNSDNNKEEAPRFHCGGSSRERVLSPTGSLALCPGASPALGADIQRQTSPLLMPSRRSSRAPLAAPLPGEAREAVFRSDSLVLKAAEMAQYRLLVTSDCALFA